MAWDEPSVGWLFRPSMAGHAAPDAPAPKISNRPYSPPMGSGQGYTQGPAETRRGAQGPVLRLAYYLRTVLSAVLTSARWRGNSFTRVSEMSSAPLRSGSSSPTVFREGVKVGKASLPLFFGKATANPLTTALFSDIIQSKHKTLE